MKKTLTILTAAAALSLLSCNQSTDVAVPVGSVQATDNVADTLMSEAQGYIQKGEHRKAIKKLKKIAVRHRLAPNAAQARILMGECYEAEASYRDAFKQYEKVVTEYEHSPLYTEALHHQLSMAHAAASGETKVKVLGLWEVGIESGVVIGWLQSIIKNAPYNDMAATSASVLGKYLMDNGMPEQARVVFTQVVESYPDSKYAPEAQLMVAKIWADSYASGNKNMVNVSKAEEAFDEFCLLYPNHPQAKKALKEAANMRSLMVEQQLQVALYYLDRAHEYQAAVFTLEDIARQKNVNATAAAKAEALLPDARKKLQAKGR